MSLAQILSRTPVQSIDEAVAAMEAIDRLLPDEDGLKWFNRLYHRVTLDVRSAVLGADFNDPAFLAQLDVVFANLYFSALAAGHDDPARAPAAWRPLLEARQTAGIARIQFALAGMNAHINRDLPDGLVQCFRSLGGDPITDRRRHEDFDRVNDILERVEAGIKADFSVGVVGALDHLGGPVDDAVAMWKVRAARAAAWTNAKILWTLRPLPPLRDEFFGRLDGLTALAGRGLLLRVDSRSAL